MTVEETIAVSLDRSIGARSPISAALRLPGVYDTERKVRRRVGDLIELLGLGAYRDKAISELSTGTRRVVDRTCLLAPPPSVLLLRQPSRGIAQREDGARAPQL